MFCQGALPRKFANFKVQNEECHYYEASWVNKLDMEHAQEAIKNFHNRPAKKQKKHRM
jgi:hypothetical protein